MSVVPIFGRHGRPTLMYGSGYPVVMNTPCYSQWAFSLIYTSNCTYITSISSSEFKVTMAANNANPASMGFDVKVVISKAISAGTTLWYDIRREDPTNVWEADFVAYLMVNGSTVQTIGTILVSDPNGNKMDTFSAPYYRFRIRCDLHSQQTAVTARSSLRFFWD